MISLSPEQIKIIVDRVARQNIGMTTLRDDLIDHLCCAVESKLGEGKNFQLAMDEAFTELAPGGLQQIEEITVQLLEENNITMKKLTYIIGLISTMAMSMVWVFRILNRGELGNVIFAFGGLLFVIGFLPLVGNGYFNSTSDNPLIEKVKTSLGVACLTATAVGILARITHFPGSNTLVLYASVCFTFLFLPVFFLCMYRRSIAI